MVNETVKCPTCKKKIQHLNEEGMYVTKNCSVLETDPRTGITGAICKTCKTRVELPSLRMLVEVLEGEGAF